MIKGRFFNLVKSATIVAPMVDVTTVPFLHLLNLISPHANHTLYTEMFHANAFVKGQFVKGNQKYYQNIPVNNSLWGNKLAVQIGTCCPKEAESATTKLINAGANEINLNVGCPSDNVQSGSFGCVLMRDPERVAGICKSMGDAAGSRATISVKCRIGVDTEESIDFLSKFVETVSSRGGVSSFVIHARRAWLKGLSPKQNRIIPQLNHELVYKCRRLFPELAFVINGGIDSVEMVKENLDIMDGVMIGRKIMNDPWFLQELDSKIYGETNLPQHDDVFSEYLVYADQMQDSCDIRPVILAKPAFFFFKGAKARAFRGNLAKLMSEAKVSAKGSGQIRIPVKFSTLVYEAIEKSKQDYQNNHHLNLA